MNKKFAATSFFDFLFVDQRRISVFSSQLDKFGQLTKLIKQTSSGAGLSAELNVPFAKIGGDLSEDDTLNQEYDAQWLVPLSFLSEMAARKIIKKDVHSANLGELVLVSGKLEILDLGMIREVLDKPVWKERLMEGTESLPSKEKKEERKNRNQALETLSCVPDTLQLRVRTDSEAVWGILSQEFLVGSASDLMIKYGSKVQGEWSVLGILDAKPDLSSMAEQLDEAKNLATANDFSKTGLAALNKLIGPISRQLLGRRATDFGITPILLFREVNAEY